ncbi:MAG: MAPEG family protein [Pseudomonadota bacterium]
MDISLLCVAVLGLLLVGLGFGVSMQRRKAGVSIGIPDDPASGLLKYGRAHANTAEYAPILALMIYALGRVPQPHWVIALMLLATASRIVFAAGMILPASLAKPNRLRFFGAVGTYLFGLALGVTLLIQAL